MGWDWLSTKARSKRWHRCKKNLTLGFGCEWEDVLGFQGKMFSPIFG
jgi:hypothetical protein